MRAKKRMSRYSLEAVRKTSRLRIEYAMPVAKRVDGLLDLPGTAGRNHDVEILHRAQSRIGIDERRERYSLQQEVVHANLLEQIDDLAELPKLLDRSSS